MAVKITQISPKTTTQNQDKVLAHLNIQNFKWINEQTLQEGVTPLSVMFDWVVNKKGRAYLNINGVIIPVFGAISPTGQAYLRCLQNNSWTDELLDLPQIV